MSKPFSIQNSLPGKLNPGVNVFFGITECQTERLEAFIERQLDMLGKAHARSLPPGFAASRQLFKSLGIDPTRHRPSAEALWRRLRDKNEFPRVNPLVDLTNLLSLKYQISFGLYDLDCIQGPVRITLGNENDHYLGIGKDRLNFIGKIVLRDSSGAFGNPSADSLRTRVHEKSTHIIQVLFFHAQDGLKETILSESLSCFESFFILGKTFSFLLETNEEQGISLEGAICKTNASATLWPSPN
ncbi:MAG: hypothetical protein JXI33_00480 [Candidatus Aminicenantes bacterium]|nr:hypothetical protein [Candidatus Aminicenantes bacterium]